MRSSNQFRERHDLSVLAASFCSQLDGVSRCLQRGVGLDEALQSGVHDGTFRFRGKQGSDRAPSEAVTPSFRAARPDGYASLA